ncbi:hypothetical protein MK079_02615, partial [Candidatus Gracilibacteria bacterium]|nr:hypothetical protein [Candidatus Gracilibacteria bacterium]
QTMQWIQSILFSKTNKIDGKYMTNIGGYLEKGAEIYRSKQKYIVSETSFFVLAFLNNNDSFIWILSLLIG